MERKGGIERVKERGEWWVHPSKSPPINSQIKVLIGMNMGLVTQINLDMSVKDEWVAVLCCMPVWVSVCVFRLLCCLNVRAKVKE